MDARPSLAELCPGASRLPPGLLAASERYGRHREVATGTVLLRQRELVRDLVVLVDGQITTLVAFSGVGDLAVETTGHPGRIFGWSGLRPPRRATATVRADRPCQVLLLPIDELIAGRPRWTAALCGLVAAGLADRAQDMATRRAATYEAGADA